MARVDEATRRNETQGPPAASKSKGSGLVAYLTELPILILFAFGIAIVIKTFLIQAFFIPSGSMLPTLRNGDRVLVEKVSYALGEPERGDVVVFARSVFGPTPPDLPWYEDVRNFTRELLGLPNGNEEDYIKRIVAVGGDTLSYEGTPRKLVVNQEVVPQPFIKGEKDSDSPQLTSRECRNLGMERSSGGCLVPQGKVFVMGDNRSNSEDSRVIGPVKEDKIVGHAFTVIWPPADISGL